MHQLFQTYQKDNLMLKEGIKMINYRKSLKRVEFMNLNLINQF